jgi:Ca2+-binding RTX toxin-like protein
MATYSNRFAANETDTNVFNTDLLTSLLRSVPSGAFVSEDLSAMTYSVFAPGAMLGDPPKLKASVSFVADGGFTDPWVGTVTGISTMQGGKIVTSGAGFAVDGGAVRDALADGDADALNLLFWSGDDELVGSKSDDTLRGFAGRDLIRGGSGDDTLIGDGGNDRLVGDLGDDNLFGGSGNDGLFGKRGSDVIVGGAGNDFINGGYGSDTMTGGTGADTFRFETLRDMLGEGSDQITDFNHSQGDKIDLSQIDTDLVTPGRQGFTFVDNTGANENPVQPGQVSITEAALAGGDPRADDDLYIVTILIDAGGETQDANFLVHSAGGVLTADDFVL